MTKKLRRPARGVKRPNQDIHYQQELDFLHSLILRGYDYEETMVHLKLSKSQLALEPDKLKKVFADVQELDELLNDPTVTIFKGVEDYTSPRILPYGAEVAMSFKKNDDEILNYAIERDDDEELTIWIETPDSEHHSVTLDYANSPTIDRNAEIAIHVALQHFIMVSDLSQSYDRWAFDLVLGIWIDFDEAAEEYMT